jgi:hypothetical protein
MSRASRRASPQGESRLDERAPGAMSVLTRNTRAFMERGLVFLDSLLGPSAVPLGVSLAVHGVLLLLIAGLALRVTMGSDRGPIPVQLALAPEMSDTPQAPDESAPIPSLSALASGEGIEGVELASPDAGNSGPDKPSATHMDLGREGTGESGAMKALSGGRSSTLGGVTFAGVRARQAKKIVYVVDASGAMISSFTWVVQELRRSIDSLDPEQEFQVVLFRDRPPTRQSPAALTDAFPLVSKGLAPATPDNKIAAGRWLASIAPMGRSNPLDGLVRGLAYTPDVVFLLSRSIRRSGGSGGSAPAWSLGREATLARLEQANPRGGWSGKRRVVIKALQFIEDDPTGTMQAIAQQHGDGEGSYRVIRPKEAGK